MNYSNNNCILIRGEKNMLDALLLSLLSVSLPLIIGGIFSLLFKKKNESFVSSFIFLSIPSFPVNNCLIL